MAKYIAQKFVAPSPEAQSIGASLMIYVRNFLAKDMAPILAKHGLSNIDPNQWYPMQLALNIQHDIYVSGKDVTEKLVAAGIQFSHDWPFPPETKTVTDALYTLSHMGNRVSRNVPAGFGNSMQTVGENHIRLFLNTPFTDDAFYGVVWGLVNRFKQKDNMFVVRIIDNPDPENYPGTCFDIKWGPIWDEINQL
jgi:hypothetical protein